MLTLYLEYLVSKYDAKTIIHLRIRTELHFRFLTEIIGMMAYQIYSDGNVKYYLSIIIDCELLLTTVTQFATMPDAFNTETLFITTINNSLRPTESQND